MPDTPLPRATPDTIETAIFAQLQSVLRTQYPDRGDFQRVIRFAGEPSPTADKRAPLVANGNLPAVLLAWEGEKYRVDAESLALGETGYIGTSLWRVWIVTGSLAGDAAALSGDAGQYALVGKITAALAGLAIEGLYRSSRLMLSDAIPVRSKRGEYLSLVRVAARRFIDIVDQGAEIDGTELSQIDLTLDLLEDPSGSPSTALDESLIDLT